MYHGILLLNKEPGMTSHDAVALVRRAARQKSVGHTGTLDPLAEGLLVICLGRGTKVARYITDMPKTYEADIHLGVRSKTYDAEGIDTNIPPSPVPELSQPELVAVLDGYRGRRTQQVPAYSAVQVGGRRLYQLARRGEEVERPEREIEIFDIRLEAFRKPIVRLSVTCSSGTYIRSLAHDIGEQIGCGGHLSALRRTAIGDFQLANALSLDEVSKAHKAGTLVSRLLAIESVLKFSAITVTDEFSRVVIQGRQLTRDHISHIEGSFTAGDHVVLKDRSGTALAIGKAVAGSHEMLSDIRNSLFSYERVLN